MGLEGKGAASEGLAPRTNHLLANPLEAAGKNEVVTIRMSSKLQNLFDLYSADLARLAPEYTDRFGCPLCHRLIERCPKLGDAVSEEHIVPRKLGGRLTTLTCRSCNSNYGSTLDAHLIQHVRVESRKRPIKARVQVGAGELGAEIHVPTSLDDQPITILGVRKQSDPDKVAVAMRAVETGERTIRLKLNFGYVPVRSSVALVRVAYLQMFRLFGYRYIFDASAKPILHQIRYPLEQTLVLKGIMWRISEPLPMEHFVSVLREPDHLRSFVVFVQLDAGTKHVAGVMLPAPGTDGSTLYSSLQSSETAARTRFTGIPMPPEGFLPFIEIWEHFFGTA